MLNLSAYTTQNIRIRLTGNRTSGDYYLAFDDFSIEPIPTCFVPTSITASSITSSGAALGWTAPSSGTSPSNYDYEVRTSGAAGSGSTGLVTSATVSSNTASISGLIAVTTYSFYVRSSCGNGDFSVWTSAYLFTTSCAEITTFPSTFDFSTYLPNSCWSEGDLGDLTGGPASTGTSVSDWTSDGFLNSGSTGCAKMNIDAAMGSEWLLTPLYTIPSTGFRIRYNVGATNWNATTAVTNWEADDFVELLVSTSSTNWTVLKIYNASNIPSHLGQEDNIGISAYNGQTVRFAFRAFEGASDGSADIDFFIDNFTIEEIPTSTWTGITNSSWGTASNWSNSTLPVETNAIIIPSNVPNFPDPSVITIGSSGSVTLNSGAKLTISGTLTNNGTLTIESGATLVQGASSTLAGTGTYNVKQDITGTNNGSSPSGRFWYLGSPVSLASSSAYFASNAANIVKKRDESNNVWVPLSSGTPENLVVGQGYNIQAMGNSTINFTGGILNNGPITTENLTSSGAGYTGFNLVSNPYPSYLDWTTVLRTNVGGTMWYRTHDGTSMNFGTVNASGVGTTVGNAILTKYIPPMQSFWVRVVTYGQAASLTFDNNGRSHFVSENGSVAGLKSSNSGPAFFIRLNLLQGQKIDQIVVYTDELSSNGLDINDAEKMMNAGNPQFYTMVGAQKTVINALHPVKKQQSLPLMMELPSTGVHSFVTEDLKISNGLVWLEDKQEKSIQALDSGTVYEFYANSGTNAERFVLHFQLIDDATPFNVYNEVNSSASYSGKGASVHAEAAGVVVIKLPATTEGVTDIQICDAAGKLVYKGTTNTTEKNIQLEQANGIYYVTLNSASGVELRKVFIWQ